MSRTNLVSRLAFAWVLLGATTLWADERPEPNVAREIFVPFEELSVILERQPRRVYVDRVEYEALVAQSRQTAGEQPPLNVALLAADYEATFERGRVRIAGKVQLEVLADGLHAVPLDVSQVGLRSAALDGRPAVLGAGDDGRTKLFVAGLGRHELILEIVAPLETTTANQVMQLMLPAPPAARWRLTAPGNVEVRSGAAVVERSVDDTAGVTRLTLLGQRGPTELVLSLNNRQRQQDRIVVARSVLVASVDPAVEQLLATVSLDVVHGTADRFRWRVPEGFEIRSVSGPLLAHWEVAANDEGRILEVRLREETAGQTAVVITAERAGTQLAEWTLPQLVPLDVAAHAAVAGLLLDPRLDAETLVPRGLVAIDRAVLAGSLTTAGTATAPGAPSLRLAAAYYAPQGDFELAARIVKPDNKVAVDGSTLLVVSAARLDAHVGFNVRSQVEPLQSLSIVVPAGWQVNQVTSAGGEALPFDVFDAAEKRTRLDVRLPAGALAQQVRLRASSQPAGWLAAWQTNTVEFPVFSVAGATVEQGAAAVAAIDDLLVLPGEMAGLTPLDDSGKARFGVSSMPTQLAYGYERAGYRAMLSVGRERPLVNARTFSFLRIEPDALVAHYELIYEARAARVDRVALLLPADAPASVSISGLDGLGLKKYTSEPAGEKQRRWLVDLAEPRRGTIRLAVDFVQNVAGGAPAARNLPLIEADGVAYQSGTVAIEGSPELDVEVAAHPRKLDVAELTDAQYQPGRRLLGVFGTIGADAAVTVNVTRRATQDLPPVLVERAELVSLVSTSGVGQTVARYLLRTKAPVLEVTLPQGATLWAVAIDGTGAQPQRDGERLLVNLPGKEQGAVRDVQIVYEAPVPIGLLGDVQISAPRLILRADAKTVYEAPTADLLWHLHVPSGYRLTSSRGTVFPDEPPRYRESLALAPLVDESRSMLTDLLPQFKYEAAPATPPASAPMAPATPPSEPGALGESLQLPTSESPPQFPPQAAQLEPDQPATTPAPARSKDWALEGLRSLKIDLAVVRPEAAVTFRSLGADPRIDARMQSTSRSRWLAAAVAAVVLVVGAARTRRPWADKARFVFAVIVVALLLPQVTGLVNELGPLSDAAVLAALTLVAYYALAAVVRTVATQRNTRAAQAATTVGAAILMLLLAHAPARADEPAEPRTVTIDELLPLLLPGGPVDVPDDAVIVPYDPELPEPTSAPRVLVPYDRYLELQRQAEAAAKPDTKAPPAEYGLAGASYRASLAGEEHIDFVGRIELESFVDRPIAIPLQLTGGVLIAAQFDATQFDQPQARVELVESPPEPQPRNPAVQKQVVPPPPLLVVHVDRAARVVLNLTVRVRVVRDGGWRRALVGLPRAAASALDIVVPQAATEIRVQGVVDRHDYETTRDGETISTALASAEQLALEWRPVVGQGSVDPSLAASSVAVFDVREDRQRLAWRVDFELRRDQRERFELAIPAGWLLERIAGDNVRGWQTRDADGGRRVDVSLLRAAQGRESMTLILTRPSPLAAGDAAEIEVPVIAVVGAQAQAGRVTVRRGPLVGLRTLAAAGWQRVDFPADPGAEVAAGAETAASPLGVVAYEAYEFVTAPPPLALAATKLESRLRAEFQTIVRLSRRDLALESRAIIGIEGPPLLVARLRVPPDLEVTGVDAPGPFEWIATRDGDMQTIEVRLAAAARGSVPLVIRARRAIEPGAALPLPALSLEGAASQQGAVVVQADPALDVRAEQLVNCETATLSQVFGWLQEPQRALARFALAHRDATYAAQLVATPREPQVTGVTVSNVRVTPRAIEETVLVELHVERAGIREASFTLPGWMRDARISAPLLRRKTVTPLEGPDARVRVQVEFQDEVMGQVRILAENDRQLSSASQQAPVPVVETGRIDRRYFTIEAAGRDEVDVQPAADLEALARQQQEWAALAALVDAQVGEAFVATGPAPQLTYRLKDRQAVETAEARINFAEARLVVDSQGSYRAAQEYRVENSTEAWLEVELPEGAQLWAAHVAGDPVKPGTVAGKARHVRIPLVKTAKGDADYPVVLKYGGQMTRPGALTRVEFPLPKTVNIEVQLSHVRLWLPETHRWFAFDGTMRREGQEAGLLAEKVALGTQQLEEIAAVLESTASNEYEKVRARHRFGSLKREQQSLQQGARGTVDAPQGVTGRLEKELYSNIRKLEELEKKVVETGQQAQQAAPTVDNRGRLHELYLSQTNERAAGVVVALDDNFVAVAVDDAARQPFFDAHWLPAVLPAIPNTADDAKKPAEVYFAKPQLDAGNKNGVVDFGLQPSSQAPGDKQLPDRDVTLFDPHADESAEQNLIVDEQRQAARYADKLQVQEGATVPLEPQLAGQEGERGARDRDDVGGGAPAQTEVPPADLAQGLASLDVALPVRGREYLFTTPRGDTQITAWAGDNSIVRRLLKILGIALAVAVGSWLIRHAPQVDLRRLTGGGVIAALVIVGFALFCSGFLPIAGALALVAALALVILRIALGIWEFVAST